MSSPGDTTVMSSNGSEHCSVEELRSAQVGNTLASTALVRKNKAAMFNRD